MTEAKHATKLKTGTKARAAADLYRQLTEAEQEVERLRGEWRTAVDQVPEDESSAYFKLTDEIRNELLRVTPPEAADGGEPSAPTETS
jgi:sulfur transfer protein SufE